MITVDHKVTMDHFIFHGDQVLDLRCTVNNERLKTGIRLSSDYSLA